jgi:two-component system response regulator
LVENNPDDVKLTIRAFQKNNISNRIVIRDDGEEAISYLLNTSNDSGSFMNPLPTVVLLDLKLTKVDGLEVLKQIRNHPRTCLLPVVILTSSTEESDIIDSYKNGANSYIRKPVDFDKFLEAVRLLGLYWLLLNEPVPY